MPPEPAPEPASTESALHGEPPRCPTCGHPVRVRVGTDVQSIDAVLESLRGPLRTAYLDRVYTGQEQADCGLVSGQEPAGDRLSTIAGSLAARFAVKEAVLKVLRPAAGEARPPWTELVVRTEPGGWVTPVLTGSALALAQGQGLDGWSCSVSHDAGVSVATVVVQEA